MPRGSPADDNRFVPSGDLTQRIELRCSRVGAYCEAEAARKCSDYIGLLTKWNKQINLTSIALDPIRDDGLDRLITEPLLASRLITEQDSLLIDVGSGGGSPAIPMKIAAPWIRLLMVETKTRKSAFLREAIRALELDNAEVANCHLNELLTRVDVHEQADVASIRAVRADGDLWSTIAGLVRPGGRAFWFSSPSAPGVGSVVGHDFVVDSRQALPLLSTPVLLVLKRVH